MIAADAEANAVARAIPAAMCLRVCMTVPGKLLCRATFNYEQLSCHKENSHSNQQLDPYRPPASQVSVRFLDINQAVKCVRASPVAPTLPGRRRVPAPSHDCS